MVQKGNSLTAQETQFLRNSQCGYERDVLVCCPPNTTMQNRMSNLLPRTPRCGRQLTDRVLGGEETKVDEFPWLALVEYTTRK